jgi:hypothetical protein
LVSRKAIPSPYYKEHRVLMIGGKCTPKKTNLTDNLAQCSVTILIHS